MIQNTNIDFNTQRNTLRNENDSTAVNWENPVNSELQSKSISIYIPVLGLTSVLFL